MYQLVSAIGKKYGNARWTVVDIGAMPLNTLYSTYLQVYATLLNPLLPNPVTLDLNQIRTSINGRNITFNEYLTTLGNQALPTQDSGPVIDTQYVRYGDAWRAGFKMDAISETAAPDAPLPISDRPLLFMTKPGLEYSDFYNYCLVSVNGLYHYSDGNSTGIYVKDGMKSINHSGRNQIGITSFKDVGRITQIPITADMIYKQNNQQQLKNNCYLNLQENYGDEKHVFIVIGGYLHMLDDKVLQRVGDSLYKINFNAYPLFDRYYESKGLIDLTALNLYQNPLAEGLVEVDQLVSDAAITALLTLPQSFIVVLDCPEFFLEKKEIQPTKLPGMHITEIEPIYPMITGYGKLANYWACPDDGKYALNTEGTFKETRVYHTVDPYTLPNLNDQRQGQRPLINSPAFFQICGRDL